MLNYVDIAICLIILSSASIGFYKGFSKEVLSLASLILALVLAFYLSDYPVQWFMPVAQDWGGEWLGIEIKGESVIFIVAFISIFLAALVIGNSISNAISRLVSQTTVLKSMDRALGAIFGLLRGALIIILLVIVAGLTKVSAYPWWQQAQFLPPFINGARYVVTLLPTQKPWHFDFELPAEKEDNSTKLDPVPSHNNKERMT